MVEVETINHKNHRSWFAWSGRIFLAVVITIMVTISHGSTAMALSNVGPSNPNDRYNMTLDKTHQYTTLEVPIYFKYNPGRVSVRVFDGRRWNEGAVFNGVWISGEGGTFEVSDFRHDELTGYWKGWVKARLGEGIKIYQFRLRLESPSDGIIAYGTGRASQADGHYNYDMRDNDGHYDKTMEMALPCSFTEPTHLGGPLSPYRLRLYDLDTWYPGWLNNNGMQPLSVGVYDETDGGRRVAYYDGNDPEYQCGQYNAGKDGVYGKHGCMGENGVLYVEMTMLPGHKYKLVIHNAWKNNLIEYELPFDNIFYNISCEPNIDMRTTVDFKKKPTGDPKKPRSGYKWLSSYGKYNSKNNNDSIAEVMGYTGANKPNTPNTLWTWTGNYSHNQNDIEHLPKAVMDKNHHKAELYPGDELTWWFRAYNVSGNGFDTSPSTDFANYREGWIDPLGQNWNRTEPKPEWMVNVFKPSERGGPLNGEGGTHHQVMWGCYNWGGKCTDYFKGFDPSNLNEGASISNQEAVNRHYRYIVESGDAGQTLCQWLRMSWNNGSWQQRFTPKACVYIPYHYPGCPEGDPSCTPNNCTMRGDCPGGTPVKRGVKPSVSAQPATVEAGGTATFTYNLNNAGPTKSKDLRYQAYTFILRSGAGLPDNSPRTVAYPMSWGAVGCGGRHVGWGSYRDGKCAGGISGNTVVYPGKDVHMTRQYRVADLGAERWLAQPGDKICSYLALDQRWNVYNDVDSRTFVASNIACVTITKKPSLQLIGSDSYAKDGFTGSDVVENIVPGTDKRGSYSQYGLLTGDDKPGVANFGSAGYTTASDKYYSLACKLSYANTDSAQVNCNDLSRLQSAGLIKPDNGKLSKPKWPTSFKGKLASQVSIDSLPASGDYSRNGSLTITGGSLGKGQHVRLFVQGNVTISGNISVNEADPIHNSLSDIPSLTVVATGDIQVEHGVSVIAGTYVAGGKFESCKGAQNKSADLGMKPTSRCQNKLKVNGAIVSGSSPIFRRTFGAGNLSDDYQWETNNISSTAEWINYTPNLWLTTSNGSSGNQLEGLTTTQVTNLPVRY